MTSLHPSRTHLVLALDVDSLDDALALVRELDRGSASPRSASSSSAPPAPTPIARGRWAEALDVFADLKLHDIPTTVGRAAPVVGRTGARYLTTHAAGGVVMVRGRGRGLRARRHRGRPLADTLAVTVLTSDPDSGPDVLAQRVAVARAVRAPAWSARRRTSSGPGPRPGAIILCPGIRPAGSPADDQARVAGPGETAAAGADLLVLGRGVTVAPDPRRAPPPWLDEVAAALGLSGSVDLRSACRGPLEGRARVTSWLRPRPSAPNSAKPR